MSGRGRGRGAHSAIREKLGIAKGEVMPQLTGSLTDTYPDLEFKPVALPELNEHDSYQVAIKKEFIEHMQKSSHFIRPDLKKTDIERYSDSYQLLTEGIAELHLPWSQFPKELRPDAVVSRKRKLERKLRPVKKPRLDVKINEVLDALEKKEADPEEELGEEEEQAEEVVEELDEVVDEGDEDMDIGTDYFVSHFDNGENYLDEDDDNADEGGTY